MKTIYQAVFCIALGFLGSHLSNEVSQAEQFTAGFITCFLCNYYLTVSDRL